MRWEKSEDLRNTIQDSFLSCLQNDLSILYTPSILYFRKAPESEHCCSFLPALCYSRYCPSATNTVPLHPDHPAQNSEETPYLLGSLSQNSATACLPNSQQPFIYSYFISQTRWEVRFFYFLKPPLMFAYF